MIAPSKMRPHLKQISRAELAKLPKKALQDYRPYEPRGAALKAWRSGRREVLLSGPAGTGKSRLWLQKAHFVAQKYPGARILFCRKTRASMTQSVLVTFEKKVLPAGWLEQGVVRWNQTDQQYEYPNGSIIAVAGLDKPSKIMSSEWDLIYVAEATELLETDWGALLSRLRNGVVPYQQLCADCNPGAPSHWLKLRCDRGETLMLYSTHKDNPSITPAYLRALRALPRLLRLRLYEGVWAAAEGMVYEEEWNPALHLVDLEPEEIPASWPRYWTIDWGFRNPFVWQAWAQNPDGELFCYREIYQTEMLVEDLAKQIKALTAHDPRPVAVICDHDIEDRKTFERHACVETVAARKDISLGVQTTKGRLRVAGNGRPGLHFARTALLTPDLALVDKHLPFSTTQEFEQYIWDERNGRRKGEVPVDKFNHGMDALRYLCMYFDDPEDTTIGPASPELKRWWQRTAYRGAA